MVKIYRTPQSKILATPMDENILQLEKPSLEVAPTTLWQVLGLLIYISYLLIYLFTYLQFQFRSTSLSRVAKIISYPT